MIDYPKGWKKTKLRQVITKGGSGGTPSSSNEKYYSGDIPFLGISDITNSNGYIYKTEKHITEEALNSSSAWIVPSGSICLVMYASVGKVAINRCELATSQAFYNMIFAQKETRDYLFQLLKWINHKSYWDPIISTGTQPNLNAQKVLDFEILIPTSLKEQKAIADTLMSFDRHIENLEKLINKKKMIRDGALEDLMSGKTRLDGFKGGMKEKELNDTRMVDYPKDWEELALGDIYFFRRGSFPQPYGLDKWYGGLNSKPFIQVVDVLNNFKISNPTKNNISEQAQPYSVKVFPGQMVITIQGSIGRVAIVDKESYLDRTLLLFEKEKIKINKEYAKYAIYKLFQVKKDLAPGAVIKTITKNVLKDFKIFVPPLEEQQAVADILTSMDNEIEQLNREKEKIEKIKEGAMDDLLTGKVRLTQKE